MGMVSWTWWSSLVTNLKRIEPMANKHLGVKGCPLSNFFSDWDRINEAGLTNYARCVWIQLILITNLLKKHDVLILLSDYIRGCYDENELLSFIFLAVFVVFGCEHMVLSKIGRYWIIYI